MAAAPQFSTDYSGLLAGLPTDGTDYSSLLQAILTPQIQALNAQSNNYWTQLGNTYGRDITQYGAYPTDIQFGDPNYSSFITPEVQALADAATRSGVSTTAQLSHAYDLAGQHSNASLAARGLIRSGALGQHSNENLQNYNVAGYGARQSLLDNLAGAYQGYLGNVSGLNSQYANDVQNAYSMLMQLIGLGGFGAKRVGGGGGGGGGNPGAVPYWQAPPENQQGDLYGSGVYSTGPQNQGLNAGAPPTTYTPYTGPYYTPASQSTNTSATASPAAPYAAPKRQFSLSGYGGV